LFDLDSLGPENAHLLSRRIQVCMDIYFMLKKFVIIEYDFFKFYFVDFLVFDGFENHFPQFDIIVVEEILRFIRIFRVFKNLDVIFFSFTKNATFTGNLKNSVQNFAAFSYFYVP
jgi:hypothetical protein